MSDLNKDGALVVFSGGQDSATCLAWALEHYRHVETIGFDYGQVHNVELSVRQVVREKIAALKEGWRDRLKEDYVYNASVLAEIGQSPLTGGVETYMRGENLPDTFVPGRNLVFLTLASALAYRRGLKQIITGVCETDFSGYPDCRDDTIKALQVAVSLGTASRLVIHTPLMWITKAQTWQLAHELGGNGLVDIIRCETHTCYRGDRSHWQPSGYGCGECAACQLRARGWSEYEQRLHLVAA
jgi:7-cyano-7-deazaguanine synthase